ncbi:hypothetical protein Efla_004854 [Eimeria flavescens]
MTCTESECQPYDRRRFTRRSNKRRRQPLHYQWKGHAPGKALRVGVGFEAPGYSGVKRLHDDRGPISTCPEEPDCRIDEKRRADSPLESLRPVRDNAAQPQSNFSKGPLQTAGTYVKRKLGDGVAQAAVFADCSHWSFPSNAEQEAEIRAEILDGARNLLQDETEIDCLVQLRIRLQERNVALLERAIHRRGVAECTALLEEALIVEANGGQLTAEGRRRTPGGVFLRLLQDRISREDKRFIWDEQNKEQRLLKRQRLHSRKVAGVWPSTKLQRPSTDGLTPPVASASSDVVCDEREPGELSADEVDAPV